MNLSDIVYITRIMIAVNDLRPTNEVVLLVLAADFTFG